MGCAMYSVSLSPASPACLLAMSSAPFFWDRVTHTPSMWTEGFFELSHCTASSGNPSFQNPQKSPKPTGALGFFPSIPFCYSQEQLLGVLKILNYWHPLPAHLSPWQLGGTEEFGDLRAGRSRLVLAQDTAPLSVPGWILWLCWDLEPALAECRGRGGSRDGCSLALRF